MRTAFRGRNFCSGTEDCEFSVPMPRFSQIPPRGRPDAGPLRRTAAPGKKLVRGAPRVALSAPATPRDAHATLYFLGQQAARPPTLGAGPRSAAGRGAVGAASGAGMRATTTRLAWRATVVGLQHERVADFGDSPGLHCAGLPRQAEGQGRRQAADGGTPQYGEPQLLPGRACRDREPWVDGSAVAGARPSCRTSANASDGKAVDSRSTGQSQDRKDPRRRPGEARDDRQQDR